MVGNSLRAESHEILLEVTCREKKLILRSLLLREISQSYGTDFFSFDENYMYVFEECGGGMQRAKTMSWQQGPIPK